MRLRFTIPFAQGRMPFSRSACCRAAPAMYCPGGPEGILKKWNKWFLAHPENLEKVRAGNVPGLLGPMRSLR